MEVCLVLIDTEVQVEWVDIDFGFKSCNRPGNCNLTVAFFVIDIFNNHGGGLVDVRIAASEVVKLFENAFALGYVTACQLKQLLFFFIQFSFNSDLRVGEHDHCQIIECFIGGCLRNDDELIFTLFEIQIEID